MDNQFLTGGDGDLEGTEARERLTQIMEGAEKGAVTNFMEAQLGIHKTLLTAGVYDEMKKFTFWRMCKFIDEDEALDHVAAFYEAEELGMSTDFNISYVFALCSANRKINTTDLISSILGSMSSFRYITNQPKGNKDHGNDKVQQSPLG